MPTAEDDYMIEVVFMTAQIARRRATSGTADAEELRTVLGIVLQGLRFARASSGQGAYGHIHDTLLGLRSRSPEYDLALRVLLARASPEASPTRAPAIEIKPTRKSYRKPRGRHG